MQEARNASNWMAEQDIKPRFLIRDGDRKFPDIFKEFWQAEDVRVIRTPPRAPKANAFVESFIGKFKREILNHFVCFSLYQLHYIVRVGIQRYNTVCPAPWFRHRQSGSGQTVQISA